MQPFTYRGVSSPLKPIQKPSEALDAAPATLHHWLAWYKALRMLLLLAKGSQKHPVQHGGVGIRVQPQPQCRPKTQKNYLQEVGFPEDALGLPSFAIKMQHKPDIRPPPPKAHPHALAGPVTITPFYA